MGFAGLAKVVVFSLAIFKVIILVCTMPSLAMASEKAGDLSLDPNQVVHEILEHKNGPWLNGPLGHPQDPSLKSVTEAINEIVRGFRERDPKLASSLPIFVHIYQNKIPNAWVRRFSRKSPHFYFPDEIEKKMPTRTSITLMADGGSKRFKCTSTSVARC